MPTPVQHATITALGDDRHVAEQKDLYRKRREILHSALASAGFAIEHSNAGLYLWATRGEDCMATVAWLAEKGVLVAPGDFYGPAGQNFVRIALTATDERVAAFADRLN
jgi:aspartate/methionine/tyrosine aminotransferase